MLETYRISFHCNNGIKEYCSIGMLNDFIFLLLVQVERFDILWEPNPRICTNYSKNLITSLINKSVRNKVVVYRSCWILMKRLTLAVHTSTDHFQKIALKYVEFIWTCSLPTLFLVVIEILRMHVRMDLELSRIHTHNILPTFCKLLVLR